VKTSNLESKSLPGLPQHFKFSYKSILKSQSVSNFFLPFFASFLLFFYNLSSLLCPSSLLLASLTQFSGGSCLFLFLQSESLIISRRERQTLHLMQFVLLHYRLRGSPEMGRGPNNVEIHCSGGTDMYTRLKHALQMYRSL